MICNEAGEMGVASQRTTAPLSSGQCLSTELTAVSDKQIQGRSLQILRVCAQGNSIVFFRYSVS